MLLARQYNYICKEFFDSLSPIELILADNHIVNSVIGWENEMQETASKKAKDKMDHPGMERYEDEEEFWDEAERAKRGED